MSTELQILGKKMEMVSGNSYVTKIFGREEPNQNSFYLGRFVRRLSLHDLSEGQIRLCLGDERSNTNRAKSAFDGNRAQLVRTMGFAYSGLCGGLVEARCEGHFAVGLKWRDNREADAVLFSGFNYRPIGRGAEEPAFVQNELRRQLRKKPDAEITMDTDVADGTIPVVAALLKGYRWYVLPHLKNQAGRAPLNSARAI